MAFAAVGPVSPVAAAPTPAPADFYGSNIQALIRVGFARSTDWPRYLSAGTSRGLRITRYDAQWNLVETSAPVAGVHTYNWASLDAIAAAIAASGARWFPVLTLPPGWAQASGTALAPAHYGDFAAFGAAFVARYGPGGSFWAARPDLPRLPVQQLEVWTEANSSLFWTHVPNAAEYLSVLSQVRDAVHAVNPSVGVLVSLGWMDFENYLRALYSSGLKDRSDGIAFHPYAPTAAGVVRLTRRLRQVTVAAGEPDLPVYMTEIGWPQSQSHPGPRYAYDGPVADSARAATAALAADSLAASDCNVKNFLYYSLVENQKNPANNEDWLGLLNANGTPTETMRAMAGSASRWQKATAVRASKTPLLPLCRGADGAKQRSSSALPADGRMPISLKMPVPLGKKPCATATARYYGDPLEDVSIYVRDFRGKRTAAVTDAYGQASLCLGAAARSKPLLAWGRVDGMATSKLQYCAGARCKPVSCKQPSLSAKRVGGAVAVRVVCGRLALWRQPIKVMAGGKVLVKAWTTAGTTVIRVPSSGKSLRVRYGGDSDFAFKARTKRIR